MADKSPNLQDVFLNACRRSHVPVTIFLVKGIKLSGVIAAFDAFSLLLRRDGQAQLVYKHSISTIVPSSTLSLPKVERPSPRSTLQEMMLAAAENGGSAATLYLVNGVMLQGTLESHDQFALLVRRGEQLQLVYKHAISTVQVDEDVHLNPTDAA